MENSMQAITQDQVCIPMRVQMPSKKCDRINSKHQLVLALHLAGVKSNEIAATTGYKVQNVYKILNREDVISARQQIMSQLDKEFEAQYRKVVQAVEDGLDANDISTKLNAAKLWGDYHKKFQKVEVNQSVNITAEDIVFNIMNNNYEDNNPNNKLLPKR